MGKRTCSTAGAIVAMLLVVASASPGSAAVSRAHIERFCLPMKSIFFQIQKPIGEQTVQNASVLALTLKRTANAAPKRIGRNMKNLAAIYTKLTKAESSDARAAMALKKAKEFASNLGAVIGFYAVRCVQAPTTPTGLPVVSQANQAACDADIATLKIAETEYSTLNGSYGTMDDLVAQQLIRASSRLHPVITVGSPNGGYTIVGGSTCNDVPVIG